MSFWDGLFSRAKCLFQEGYPKLKVSPPWFGRLRAPGFSMFQLVAGSNGVMLMLQQLIADAKERRNFAHFGRFLLNAKEGPTYPVSASTSKLDI